MTHKEKALELFAQRFQCSQAVLAAFAEEFGLTQKQALQIGACFGGGMCKGEVCGACAGALMVLRLDGGYSEAGNMKSKDETNQRAIQFLETFAKENGSYICRELLGCDLSTAEGKRTALEKNLFTEFCPKMVASAVEIIETMRKEKAD